MYHSETGDISIALTGDSLITRSMRGFTEPRFLKLVNLLRRADVAVTNAEMLFHHYEHPPTAIPGGTYMQADPAMIDELRWMGITMLSAANNHNYDYGENGLLTHLGHLERSGLVHAGLGRNLGEAREPKYLDTEAGRVALISVTSSGPASLCAAHQWRDGLGRPGANMLRYTTHYTVDRPAFEQLRRIRDAFGLADAERSSADRRFRDQSRGMAYLPEDDENFYMRDLQNQWQFPAPDGYRFTLGDGFARRIVPDSDDLAENLQRIHDARRMADWVIVSMHNHEDGDTADLPSDAVTTFARAAIDAGADVFHGHGPHRDRGIEIYRGRPIFYSIGHFILQNETVQRMAWENIVRQGLSAWESTPADFYDSRTGDELNGELRGLANKPEAWRDAVAVVTFKSKSLFEVRLHPIDLGYRRPRSQRGRPMLAEGEVSDEVLDLFTRLSAEFGTDLKIEDDTGVIRP